MGGATKDTNFSRKLRRGLLIAFLLGVIAAAAFVYETHLRIPSMGTGPAGPAVPAEPFRAPWSDRPVMLVGLGDSVTRGFGASPGLSYFERLVKNPQDEFSDMQGRCLSAVFPHLTTLNLAVSGSTSRDCLRQQLPQLPRSAPETFGYVVITTGGNDLIHAYGEAPPREIAMYGATMEQARPWIADYEARLGQIVDGIYKAFPGGCRIFLANIYDPTDGTGNTAAGGFPPWPDMEEILAAYNTVIERTAQLRENVWLVDIHQPFLGHGFACRTRMSKYYDAKDPHFWYYTNIEDPNNRGYDTIRRCFLLAMIASQQSNPIPEPSVNATQPAS